MIAAVANGADAVYLGLKQFNARAKASNFDEEELKWAIDYSHFFGVKVYLTANTLYKPQEKIEVLRSIQSAYHLGIDAVIIQDLSILPHIRSTMPNIIIHLSTQAGIHNAYGAKTAQLLGANRIILSREATLDDIKQIKASCNVEIECFVQGALCVSFSGNCYFSSIVSGYSGNRGKCLQLCRKPYEINGNKGYWLSPKDLCLVEELNALREAGVDSLKIEGRMRRPEYVAVATKTYRNAIDGKPYNLNLLKAMFNRGDYTIAHLNDPTENVIFPKVQGHLGVKHGKVLTVNGKIAKLSTPLNKGDGVKFLRDGREVGSAAITQDGSLTGFSGTVKPNDEVRLTTDAALLASINESQRMRGVSVHVYAYADAPIKLSLTSGSHSVNVTSDFSLDRAQNAPLSEQDITSVFAKCKEYGFLLEDCTVLSDYDCFAPKSALNAFRRTAFEQFRRQIVSSYVKQTNRQETNFTQTFAPANRSDFPDSCLFVLTDDESLLPILKQKATFVAYFPRDFAAFCQNVDRFDPDVFLYTPQIVRSKEVALLEAVARHPAIKRVVANNAYAISLFCEKEIVLGAFFNVIDDSYPAQFILSPEGGISRNGFTYAYGHFPFMTLCHCPKKNLSGNCNSCKGYDSIPLSDEQGRSFTFKRHKILSCYAHLINEAPIDLSAHHAKRAIAKPFLDLCGKSKEEALQIVQAFVDRKPLASRGISAFSNKNLE